MKILLSYFLLFCTISLSKAQDNSFQITCLNHILTEQQNINDSISAFSANCANTSQYFTNKDLYLPQTTDDIVYLRLNFIFLTKPDGTGNFEQNNIDHVNDIDAVIEKMNYRLGNLAAPLSGCEGYGNANLIDTRIRVIVNKIWRADPAWDFLLTGYNPDNCTGRPCVPYGMVYPPASNYYYSYFDNDPTIPFGINIVFANNGQIYNDFMNGLYNNYPDGPKDQWAASEDPTNYSLDKKLRQFFPDLFTKYIWMKNYVVGHPKWNNPTWETVRSWFVNVGSNGGFIHELGHNFGLSHSGCPSYIMSYGPGTHDYFSNTDIKQIYYYASNKSVRQYFTETSFKNSSIDVTNNEHWDLNFRLYSNVKIDNNSSLKATCKIIMAPDSRFIVKDGSNFIIEGADITSANNSTWNGIKVEGDGYLMINPNTLIDTNHFYAYADNTPLPYNKSSTDINKIINSGLIENAILDKDYRIYPNPTGDFINIETKSKISKVEIYNLLNKSFFIKYKDNQVDVTNLPSGNYILNIYTDSKVKSVNFIKK